MMYLLDTHVFLWSLCETKRLSRRAVSILRNENLVYISSITLWEISIKYGLGKLELSGESPEGLWKTGKEIGFKLLEMKEGEALSFYKLERLHKDAFDRMIIWQAIKNDMTLLSKDDRMEGYKTYGLKLLW